MEDIAAPSGPGPDPGNLTFHHVDVPLLEHQAAFFFFVKDTFNYLNHRKRQLSGKSLRQPLCEFLQQLNGRPFTLSGRPMRRGLCAMRAGCRSALRPLAKTKLYQPESPHRFLIEDGWTARCIERRLEVESVGRGPTIMQQLESGDGFAPVRPMVVPHPPKHIGRPGLLHEPVTPRRSPYGGHDRRGRQ